MKRKAAFVVWTCLTRWTSLHLVKSWMKRNWRWTHKSCEIWFWISDYTCLMHCQVTSIKSWSSTVRLPIRRVRVNEVPTHLASMIEWSRAVLCQCQVAFSTGKDPTPFGCSYLGRQAKPFRIDNNQIPSDSSNTASNRSPASINRQVRVAHYTTTRD